MRYVLSEVQEKAKARSFWGSAATRSYDPSTDEFENVSCASFVSSTGMFIRVSCCFNL